MTENLDQLREIAQNAAALETEHGYTLPYVEAMRLMHGHLRASTVLALIDRVEAAEESHRLANVMLRTVLEEMGSGPETDPIIKVRQLVARAEAAEAQVARVREIAKADLKCPCCSGYEEILRTLDGDTRRLADQGLGDNLARTTKNGENNE